MTVTSKKKIGYCCALASHCCVLPPQRDNRVKVSAILLAGHKVSKIANLVGCVARPSTRSRSAWTMTKMSIDGQEAVERLLWTVTTAGCHSRDSLRDAVRGITVFRPLPARLLTPWIGKVIDKITYIIIQFPVFTEVSF